MWGEKSCVVYSSGFRSKTLFCSRPHPPALRRHALPLGVAIGPPGPSSRMVPKLARELASEHDGTPSFLAELQIGDARRGGHLHPRVSRGYGDLCSDVVRIIDMNNLEAEGTSRKNFPSQDSSYFSAALVRRHAGTGWCRSRNERLQPDPRRRVDAVGPLGRAWRPGDAGDVVIELRRECLQSEAVSKTKPRLYCTSKFYFK